MADQYTRGNNQILKGQGGARWILTPATTGVPAVGVVLTSGAGAWGAYADLIAAGAIAAEHWIGSFFVNTSDAVTVYEIQVRDATPATLYEFRINPTATTQNLGAISPPYPIWRPAGAQTQARCGNAAAKVIGVSTLYTLAL